MVAASKLRRAQERIMNARPYAVQMQRVLGSVAARVDPSIHPLLQTRELRPEPKTLVIVVTGDKGLCGSFNTNVIKAGAAFVVETPGTVRARAGRPQGARLLRPPRLRRAVRAGRHLPEAAVRGRPGDRADGGRRVPERRSRPRGADLQRVQVGDDAARRRRPAAADRARGRGRRRWRPRRMARRRARATCRSTTCTSRRRRRSSTSCCRATSRCRCTARCSSRTPRSSPRR